MVKCGEHSDLKPWEDGYAAVKRQLGEWTVTIEGWEDAYVSWLHDARIKVRVMDDVDNALNSGAELLARWAETPDTRPDPHAIARPWRRPLRPWPIRR